MCFRHWLIVVLILSGFSRHVGAGEAACELQFQPPELARLQTIIEENRATWTCGDYKNVFHINHIGEIWDQTFHVQTLDSSALVRRYVTVKEGLLFLGTSTRPLNTSYAEALIRFGPKYLPSAGDWLFVLYKNGSILLSPNGLADIKHSSIAPGGVVASAGQIRVVDGKIVFVSNHSGHFLPNKIGLAQFLFQLECLGADVSAMRVQIW